VAGERKSLEEEENAMTKTIWKLVVGAFLAAISVSVLAIEPKCTADVCNDPTWGEMRVAAPSIALGAPVTKKVAAAAVKECLDRDELVAGRPDAAHAHFECAVSNKAEARAVNESVARDELAAGRPEAVHAHPLVAAAK
jgi:hypothetical protein